MNIIFRTAIRKFAAKHPEARNRLHGWATTVENISPTNFSELRLTFRTADYVPKFTVFDVGGNSYRVVTVVDYVSQRVYIHKVLTHAEYDKWSKDYREK